MLHSNLPPITLQLDSHNCTTVVIYISYSLPSFASPYCLHSSATFLLSFCIAATWLASLSLPCFPPIFTLPCFPLPNPASPCSSFSLTVCPCVFQRPSGGASSQGQGGSQAPRGATGAQAGRDPQELRQGGRSGRQEVMHSQLTV